MVNSKMIEFIENPNLYNPLVLAYVGDSLYDIYVRSRLISENEIMPKADNTLFQAKKQARNLPHLLPSLYNYVFIIELSFFLFVSIIFYPPCIIFQKLILLFNSRYLFSLICIASYAAFIISSKRSVCPFI